MARRLWLLLTLCSVGSVAWAQLPPVPDEAGAEAELKPRLVVAQQTIDLGKVLEGDVAEVRWRLENQGSADLVIESTRAGCGCTVIKLAEEERIIPPGGSLVLKAEFNSTGRPGKQTKKVTVVSNDPAEPTLKLRFMAEVESLFAMVPSNVVNLRHVQRGEPASKTLDITPAPGRKSLEVLDVQVRDEGLLHAAAEPLKSKTGNDGWRIRFTAAQEAPLGALITSATIFLSIDDLKRERTIPIRGEVVGDLTWHPKVIDATRQRSRRGKRLAPVVLRSTDKMPFDVLSAGAGPLLDVTFEPVEAAPTRTQYTFHLTLREDAAPGPFGTTLEVRTSCMDQPLITVPVFGIVASAVRLDPPIVLLRRDGTRVSAERRVKLMTSPRLTLEVLELNCPMGAVSVAVWEPPGRRRPHIRFLDVRLTGTLPEGRHETVITLKTNVEGAETLTIPVTIEVPES